MTNHYAKYKDFVINTFQDNQRKPCGLPTDRPTDRRTDRQTDRPTLAKQYTPSSSKGGIKREKKHFRALPPGGAIVDHIEQQIFLVHVITI
jgi:hypothetical protein